MVQKNGFTLLEMIIVLAIICLIFVLTLPNIRQKQDIINAKGCEALVEVVNSQILLYKIETGEEVDDIDELIVAGYLKEKQARCSNGSEIYIVDGQAEVAD